MWVRVALLVGALVVTVLVSGRLEARVHEWLLRVGRDRAPRTALALVGASAALGAVLALAGVAAYAVSDDLVGGAVLLVVATLVLTPAMVFSPSSWNAPRVAEETAALRERGASRATAYTVFWVGFVCLVALLGAATVMLVDLWLV